MTKKIQAAFEVPKSKTKVVRKKVPNNTFAFLADAIAKAAVACGMRPPAPGTDFANRLATTVMDMAATNVLNKRPSKVYVVTIDINMPETTDDRNLVLWEAHTMGATFLFNEVPSADDIVNAIKCDLFLLNWKGYSLMKEIVTFCLCTWGAPELPTKPLYDITMQSVDARWTFSGTMNNKSYFNHRFGGIRITTKSVN